LRIVGTVFPFLAVTMLCSNCASRI